LSSEAFARQYVDERRPVVLKGAMARWTAIEEWSVDYFREHYGDLTTWIALLPYGLSHPPNRETQMNLGNFLDIVQRQEEEVRKWGVIKRGEILHQRKLQTTSNHSPSNTETTNDIHTIPKTNQQRQEKGKGKEKENEKENE
jgi:hypothetical protein